MLSQAKLAVSPDHLVRSVIESKVKLCSSSAKAILCHSDKQTRFSYSQILLLLISFKTLILRKKTNSIHSDWQSQFLLWKKFNPLLVQGSFLKLFHLQNSYSNWLFCLFFPLGVTPLVLRSFIDCLPFLAALKRMKKDDLLSVLTATTMRFYITTDTYTLFSWTKAATLGVTTLSSVILFLPQALPTLLATLLLKYSLICLIISLPLAEVSHLTFCISLSLGPGLVILFLNQKIYILF